MRSSGNCQIAVFLDHCNGELSHLLDEEMIRYISGLPHVVSCDQDENLSSPGRLEMLAGRLKEGRADRAVIVGGSPAVYEGSLRRLDGALGLNPYMFLVANVREQVAWTIRDHGRAREKARTIIARKIREACLLNAIGRERVEIPAQAVVVGGGIVGIRAALALADANIRVTLLTRAKDIGGKAVQLAHFYDRPGDVSSWFEKQVERVKGHPGIDVKTSVELRGFEGHLGDYRITIRDTHGKGELVRGSAVLLASGYDVVPTDEGIFGHRCFISPPQLEAMLREGEGSLVDEKGNPIKTITFMLDLVNETIKIDSANAVKNALLLRKDHDCRVYVVCRDVKVSLDGMERQYRRAREMGVIFVKYDDPPRFSLVNGAVNVEVKEVATRVMGEEYTVSILSDLVVMSEKFVPSKDNEMLAAIFGIPLPQEGFLMDDNPQFTLVRGEPARCLHRRRLQVSRDRGRSPGGGGGRGFWDNPTPLAGGI